MTQAVRFAPIGAATNVYHAETLAVRLTPPGRGAVATILVHGPRAEEYVAGLFHPAGRRKLSELPLKRIVFGRWDGPGGEELVVCRVDHQRVEVHCHGGQAAPAAVLESLVERGCRAVEWRDWIAWTETDPIRAQATVALSEARTERTAAILLDQHGGALRGAIDELGQLVARRDATAALARLESLLAWRAFGLHLVQPWDVVLAGRPNAGKSSLINALVGYRRAIVSHAPGTTRDVVTAETAFSGWPFRLSDTAGLRATADPLEAAGVERARSQLARADGIVLVVDASLPWIREDEAMLAEWPTALVVYNKSDLVSELDSSRPPGVWTSAVTRLGLGELEQAIVERLVPQAPEPGAAIPFTEEQFASLAGLESLIRQGDWAEAESLLRRDPPWRHLDQERSV